MKQELQCLFCHARTGHQTSWGDEWLQEEYKLWEQLLGWLPEGVQQHEEHGQLSVHIRFEDELSRLQGLWLEYHSSL